MDHIKPDSTSSSPMLSPKKLDSTSSSPMFSPISSPQFGVTRENTEWENEIFHHPAYWTSEVGIQMAEQTIWGKEPGTYMINGLMRERTEFTLHWVRENHTIANSLFHYNPATKKWYYKNLQDHEYTSLSDMIKGLMNWKAGWGLITPFNPQKK